MLIMAILAALVVVIVATGGAVVGALICGQKAAAARKRQSGKSDMIIQGQRAITGGRQMKCMLFDETISFAPEMKT
jgi:hypothetical protein